MLLGGILLCYTNTFFLLAEPMIITCAIQRLGVGTGFSIIYGALFTKTNRISRIFDSASRSAKRPSFISPKSQVMITSSIIGFQVNAALYYAPHVFSFFLPLFLSSLRHLYKFDYEFLVEKINTIDTVVMLTNGISLRRTIKHCMHVSVHFLTNSINCVLLPTCTCSCTVT